MPGPMDIRVTVDDSAVRRMLDDVRRNATPRAEVSALNETSKRIRTAGAREVAAKRNLPVGLVRQRIFFGGSRRATRARKRALLDVGLSDVGVHRLKPRQTRAGVKAQGGRKYPNAFLARPRAGWSPQLVFRRTGRARYPIEVVKVPIKLQTRRTLDRLVLREGGVIFKRVFEQQMKRFTARYR